MKSTATVLFYCQHSLGIGHLKRSLCTAEALAQTFRVVFLNGGPIPAAIPRPDSIEFIDLPPIRMGADGVLYTQANKIDLRETKQSRRQLILEQFEALQPEVIIIELFPFGRKKFTFELLPLLRHAHCSHANPKVICSVRDILVGRGEEQLHHDNRARWLIDRYFDAVIVHADTRFCDFGESFKPERLLSTPIFYSGFVSQPTRSPDVEVGDHGIVVSAGGGSVGGRLLQTCAAAQARIWRECRIPMTVVAGPFLPEEEWLALQRFAGEGLTLYRSVPDLRHILNRARASISQCGYNTTMDLLSTGIPSLLAPYAEANEDEQMKRAKKLVKLDAAQLLPEHLLNEQSLYHSVKGLLAFRPRAVELDMDGAEQTRRIVSRVSSLQRTTNGAGHEKVA